MKPGWVPASICGCYDLCSSLQQVDMRYSALIRRGDLAVEHDRPAAPGEALEWAAEEWRAIMAIAAEQFELAAARNDRD